MDLLFSRGELDQALRSTEAALIKEVDGWDADQLLAQPEHEIAAFLADKHSVRPPVLRRDDMYADEPKDGKRLISDRLYDEDVEISVSSLRVHVPFDGEEVFFSLRPSRYTLNPPRAHVGSNELVFEFEDRELNGEQIASSLDRELASIEGYLGASTEMATRHNGSVLETALSAIRRRKERLLADRNTVAGLGIPVRRRGDPPAVAVPVKARSPRIERPQPSAEPYEPEWMLSESDYEEAVRIIVNSGIQMERSPSTALQMDEEERRDLMLVALNAVFEGQAGGEVFNGSGKTDILLRVENRNVFIAECKIWRGQKSLTDAIDQLLGYLVWRDTKAALAALHRDENATQTIERAIETLERHPHCLRTRSRGEDGGRSDFVYKSTGDEAREIRLAFVPVVITAPYGAMRADSGQPQTLRRTRDGPSGPLTHISAGQRAIRSDVVVQGELVGVGAQADRVDLVLALVLDPGVDEVVGEHAAGLQEVLVGLERVERGLAATPAPAAPWPAPRAAGRRGPCRPASGGSMRLSMPSRPAISMAEKARYGLPTAVGAAELDALGLRALASTAGCGTTPSGCAGCRPG